MEYKKLKSPVYFEKEFEIDGIPKGKKRPRFSSKTMHTYTPKDTVDYENYIKLSYKVETGGGMLNGPISADITGVFPIPKSTSDKKKEAMLNNDLKYTKKIDCDNLAKTVLDALNGIAYQDDAQIFELKVKKMYGNEPKVIVKLKEVPDVIYK